MQQWFMCLSPQIFMCRIFLYIQKQFNMSFLLSYMSYQNHVGLQPANLVTYSHVLRSRRSELSSPSFFVPYVVFAFNFFLFSVRPPNKSVTTSSFSSPSPFPSSSFRPVLYVRILYVRVFHDATSSYPSTSANFSPVGDFSGRYRYCSGRVGNFSLPVGTSYLLL